MRVSNRFGSEYFSHDDEDGSRRHQIERVDIVRSNNPSSSDITSREAAAGRQATTAHHKQDAPTAGHEVLPLRLERLLHDLDALRVALRLLCRAEVGWGRVTTIPTGGERIMTIGHGQDNVCISSIGARRNHHAACVHHHPPARSSKKDSSVFTSANTSTSSFTPPRRRAPSNLQHSSNTSHGKRKGAIQPRRQSAIQRARTQYRNSTSMSGTHRRIPTGQRR